MLATRPDLAYTIYTLSQFNKNPNGEHWGPQLQQMEHKARKVLFDLWDSCWRNYVEPGRRVVRILPPAIGALVDAARGRRAKARQICDWLAGLTDGMIVRTYKRLFNPDFGSIRDLS